MLDASRWYTVERYELHRHGSRYDELRLTIDRDAYHYMVGRIVAHLSGALGLLHRVEVVVKAGSRLGTHALRELGTVVALFADPTFIVE